MRKARHRAVISLRLTYHVYSGVFILCFLLCTCFPSKTVLYTPRSSGLSRCAQHKVLLFRIPPPLHLDHLDSNPTCISPASDVTSGPLRGFCTPSFLHPENRDNHHAPHRIIAEIKRQCRQCVEPSKCSTNICYYDYYAKCPINTCSMNKQVKPEDTGAHRLLQGNRKGICSPG